MNWASMGTAAFLCPSPHGAHLNRAGQEVCRLFQALQHLGINGVAGKRLVNQDDAP
jgi:hypothetical protein